MTVNMGMGYRCQICLPVVTWVKMSFNSSNWKTRSEN